MKELRQRIKSATPRWFRRVRKGGIYISSIGLALLAANVTVPGFELPSILIIPCQWAAVAGITASAVSTTAKEDKDV